MPGSVGDGAVLSPACHAAVDQSGIGTQAFIRAESESFHHSGPKSLDQCVCLFDEAYHDVTTFGLLNVDGDVAPATVHQVEAWISFHAESGGQDPIYSNDVSSHVSQQHRTQRAGANASHLYNFDAT